METIDDIRRENDNPRAQVPAGPPRSIFSFFSESTGPRLVAMLLIVLGVLLIAIGAFMFVAPFVIVGLAIVIVAGFGYVWAKPKSGVLTR